MKRFLIFLLVPLTFFTSAFTMAQGGIKDVISAMNEGDANELSKYMDDGGMEITLPGKSSAYSKSQATMILKDFFANNSVKKFEVKHQGDQAGGQFCVGTLQTKTGSYRTTIFMKTGSGGQVMREMRLQAVD